MFNTYMNETVNDLYEANPVFLMLTQGTSVVGKTIRVVTHCPFSHASISLDPELRYFFSYNMSKDVNDGKGGLVMETREKVSRNSNKSSIYVFFVNHNIFKKIAKKLSYYSKNKEKTKYDKKKLIQSLFNLNYKTSDLNQVCSSFCDNILKSVNINLAKEKIKCVKPSDFFNTIKNNEKLIYKIYEGPLIELDIDDIKIKLKNIVNKNKLSLFNQKKLILNEEIINPELVDRSNYDNFILHDFFHIYTTDKLLRNDPKFNINMLWVKNKINEICNLAHWTLFPYELTLCASFDDLNEFYNHQAPIWVTGFTLGDKVYMKAPNIYNGNLYYNVVLHECFHVQMYLNEKIKGKKINREDEEGMAVFFSTPLDKWLAELNHGPNWYYYESAIRVQEDFMQDGMDYVMKKRLKRSD